MIHAWRDCNGYFSCHHISHISGSRRGGRHGRVTGASLRSAHDTTQTLGVDKHIAELYSGSSQGMLPMLMPACMSAGFCCTLCLKGLYPPQRYAVTAGTGMPAFSALLASSACSFCCRWFWSHGPSFLLLHPLAYFVDSLALFQLCGVPTRVSAHVP